MENGKSVKTFKDLLVWQKAHKLVLNIYKITQKFPAEERFGLTSQLRRAASSIPTNIVEGYKRNSRKEYLYFLHVADSSLEETKYHTLLAKDLGYLSKEDTDQLQILADEVGRMLFGLRKNLPSISSHPVSIP